MDCFCAHALGIEIESLKDPNSPFSHAFNTAVRCTAKRALAWPFVKFFPFLFPSAAELTRSIATLDSIIFGMIHSRRQEVTRHNKFDS